MGKKIKKDEKATAEDTFDTLLVESKQAETVVLMLDSPEDEVQMKACQAIYKFIGKCDENKDLLYKLQVCTKLIKLMQSEDKTVRRDSVMVMGVMTENETVKKWLRSEKKSIGILIKLLSNEEHPTTNEFSAICLCNLCSEYMSIAQVIEENGVPSLVECLNHDDPDVQKNAITCLDLVLRDFEARPLLKSCEGLTPMIELLKSEFPVIQDLVLKALSKAVLDSNIRAVLREMECMGKFVDIIGRPEFNDLHCICLQVIGICLEDLECVKQLKDSGGLIKLISFIGDAQPPEDDGKEKPKKTSKAGSAKKKKKEDEEKPKESVASFTLPEVKVQACKAIAKAAQIEDIRRILHEVEAERLLVALLSHENEPVRSAASYALAILGQASVTQSTVLDLGGIEQLVRLLKSDHKDLRESVSLALANMTSNNTKISQEVVAKHGLESLISCLSANQESICTNALVVISNMSTEEAQRSKLLQSGLAKSLVVPLKSQSVQVQKRAALVVASCLVDNKSRNDFRNNGGIPPLAGLLKSQNSEVRKAACWAINIIGTNKECAELLIQEGAITQLQLINGSNSKKNKFSETALNRLYDSNLNMKYALTGYLDFTDQIGDQFFDCGALKPNSEILSLDEYCQQSINNKRPIILINTLEPREAITPSNSTVTDHDEKKEDKSSKKKGPKSKRDRRTSVNPTPPEETLIEQASVPQHKPIPNDTNILKLIDDASEVVGNKEKVEEQYEALAKFVSNIMGGVISKENLMSFPYEMELSKLKVENNSNVIPIGQITLGIHVHRALLFKYLADRLFLPTNLNRGDYNRSWNEVWIMNKDQKQTRLNPKLYIVDLIHEPGKLILKDSQEGHSYRRL